MTPPIVVVPTGLRRLFGPSKRDRVLTLAKQSGGVK